MNTGSRAITAACCVLFALGRTGRAAAHDSWLIADQHRINNGDEVWLSFVTGEIFPFGDGPTDIKRVAQFVDRTGKETMPIPGLAPEDEALSVRIPIHDGGIHVIGLSLKPRLIELDTRAFEHYLKEERAEKALALRRQSGETGPAVERYTKFAKTIIEVEPADPDDTGYQAPLGQRLEIIPLSNPLRWQAKSRAQFQVLLDGHPWPNVPVSAGHEGLGKHEYVTRTRTDANGVAVVALERPGHWFVRAHLIRRSTGLAAYGWESFWSSFTFTVRGRTDVQGDIRAIRRVHGTLSPWAVVGYRMGKRALRVLALPPGSRKLLVVHRTPLEKPYAAMTDGIQAATAATVGKLNLRIEEAEPASLRSEFTNRASGRTVGFRLRREVIEQMRNAAPAASEDLAKRLLIMPDEMLFESIPRPDTPPSPPLPRKPPSGQDRIKAVPEDSRSKSRGRAP
ncbi:MAG: DUF4198 domain-containing protein [Phycisphaerae bacterium]